MIFDKPKTAKVLLWQKIKTGDNEAFSVLIMKRDVEEFIKLSGDVNPLHNTPSFARQKGFAKPVVPGMMLASFFSTLVGTYLPGRNNLYLSQNLQFRKPIFIGETVRISGRVTKKVQSVKILYIETKIFNANNEPAVTGEAIIKYI